MTGSVFDPAEAAGVGAAVGVTVGVAAGVTVGVAADVTVGVVVASGFSEAKPGVGTGVPVSGAESSASARIGVCDEDGAAFSVCGSTVGVTCKLSDAGSDLGSDFTDGSADFGIAVGTAAVGISVGSAAAETAAEVQPASIITGMHRDRMISLWNML